MKKTFLLFFVLSLSLSLSVNAQFMNSVGARQAALGNSGVILSDVWSSSHNQAGLAGIETPSVGIYAANYFGLSELGMKAISIAAPVSTYGTFGVNYSNFGYGLYTENKFGLAYAMQMGEKFSAGIQLDYFLVKQGLEYGQTGAAVGEIGVLANPIDNLYIAAHLFNVSRTDFSAYQNEKIPSVLRIGIGYSFSEKVLFTIEAEKDLETSPILRSGIEYQIIENLFLRAGVSTQNNLTAQYSFGAGYGYKGIIFDFAFVNHQMLGYTAQFGLGYSMQKKPDDVEEITSF